MADLIEFSKDCLFCERALKQDDETVNLSVRETGDIYIIVECHLNCLGSALRDKQREVFESRLQNFRRIQKATKPTDIEP